MKKTTRRQGAKTAPKANGPVDATEIAHDDVTERIRITLATAIGEGALKPGVKILEDAIADHFGVSRTVVRGALGVLESDHLLERKKNRGTFVAEPTSKRPRPYSRPVASSSTSSWSLSWTTRPPTSWTHLKN